MADRPTISYQTNSNGKSRTWRDDVSAEWSRFSGGFTRENVTSHLKTLAWVVPLTLLIWIWAEREQVATRKDAAVPFELVNSDPARSATLKPPQDRDKNLVLELQGPQGRLQELLDKLSGGPNPKGLSIEVPPNLETNREHLLDALSLVRAQRDFAQHGITVMGVQPSRLQIIVDRLEERDARIVRPPQATNLDVTFEPATVRVRGPQSILSKLDPVVYADLPDDKTRSPGPIDISNVALRRPPELEDARVTIVVPPAVHARGEVRRADKRLLIPSMPITTDLTDGLGEKYKVVWERPSVPVLSNVTVVGPPEIIDLMERPNFQPQPGLPKARLIVTQQDVGERRTKAVKYDLPDKVSVVEEDRNRTVEFRLVPWTTPPSLLQ